MGTSLTGLTPATTYDALIKVGDNGPITSTLKTLSDGLGNDLPMEASSTAINFTNGLQQGGIAVPTASQVAAKQDTLVSGTNIKTINGTSVLGSGNIVTPTTSPSGVSGAIQFSDGSAFASDAANFFWDNTNKRLGIGTNAPTSKLSISSASATILDWSRTASASGYLYVTNIRTGGQPGTVFGSDYFSFRNASLENYIVSESNRLGIGTNNDALTSRLQVKGSGSTSATTSLLVQNSAATQVLKATDDGKLTIGTNAGNGGALLFQYPNLSNGVYWGDDYSNIWGSITLSRSSGEMRIFAASGGYFQTFFTQGAERMRINDAGRIGIGTAAPNASSLVDMTSTTQGFLPPRMTTTQKNAITSPAAGLVVYDSTTNKLCCYNGSTWNDLF
jgi:hypothetical protein